MKELVVISGKGGTGKTSIVASLATLAGKSILADCDVDAADLHLVLEPTIKRREDFIGGKQAFIIEDKCIGCGRCEKICKFDAIEEKALSNGSNGSIYKVDSISCEGCGVCVEFCPNEAIEFNEVVNGEWFVSDTRYGTMVHATLGIAQENSGKLVSLIRREAKDIAKRENQDLIIVDGSPGIGCPVIASITGADVVLVITEPTLSGLHDLERVVKLAVGFDLSIVVAINKYDLNPDMSEKIEAYASQNDIEVVGKIHYDKAFTKAQINKESLIEYNDSLSSKDIKEMWKRLSKKLDR